MVKQLLFGIKLKKLIKAVAATCFLILNGLNYSMAQQASDLPTKTTMPNHNIAFSSPEAAALGKYGDIPVSHYTGVPNISLPIYTISLKGIQLPISLSYHAGGIKVEEMASNVGLGWTLNTGGSLTIILRKAV